jgi:PAS domain S-box-containing protein
MMQSAVKFTLGNIIAASILFAAGVFLVMAVGSIYSIEQMARAADWVAHTEEVESQVNAINALVLDLESATRGFLITGQDEYLNSFYDVMARLDGRLDSLHQLILDNPPQLERWKQLKILADKKMQQVTAVVENRRQDGYAAALTLFNAGDPSQAGAALRNLIAQMLQAEDTLLAQRRADNDWQARRSVIAAVATSTVGLVVLTIATWLIMHQLKGRMKAEAQLAKSRAELQGVLDNSPAGIFLKDLDGRYILLNEPMKDLLGMEPAAALDKTAAELFSAERAQLIKQEDADVLAKGLGQEIEFEIMCEDGVRRVFRTLKFPLRDAKGRVYALGGISTDITERRYMVNEMRRALAAAEAASRTKSQFLANMSHELRTPLNSIIGFSEILSDRLIGPLGDKQLQYTTNILSSGRHLLLLINDLLDLAKIESGKVQLEPEHVMFASLVEESVAHMRGLADRKGIILDVQPTDPALLVQLDPARVKQIIYNLTSNAIKFTPNGGRVMVAAKQVTNPPAPSSSVLDNFAPGTRLFGNWLFLTVTDNGIGIESKDLERIFIEFEQVDSTYSRQQEGTGLGLTLVRKLASLHGGYAWAESAGRINHGSTFCVLLPVNGPSPETENRHLSKPIQPAAKPDGEAVPLGEPPDDDGQPLVLVIEDDQQASHLIAEHLSTGGYRTAHARTGAQAMQMAAELQPVAITLDVLLPDANGMDVLSQLKAAPATSHIPIIIVSVTDDRQLGLSLGAAEFLVKPVGADRLLEALARAQANAQKNIQDVLVVDDEAAARESIAAILEPRGYEVWASASGKEALQLIARHVPDVAIIDLMMPGMSGFELVKHLRQHPPTRELPICIYTAKDLSPSELRWLREQSAAVTPKPFRELLMDELQRIRAHTEIS